jgi:hypothetical protein
VIAMHGNMLVRVLPLIASKLPFSKEANASENVSVKRVTFEKSGILTATISNNNFYDIKDVVLHCSQMAKSGTEIGNAELIAYVKIDAGTSETVAETIGDIPFQTYNITCNVVNVTLLNTNKGRTVKVGDGSTIRLRHN